MRRGCWCLLRKYLLNDSIDTIFMSSVYQSVCIFDFVASFLILLFSSWFCFFSRFCYAIIFDSFCITSTLFQILIHAYRFSSQFIDFDILYHYLLQSYIFWSWIRDTRYCFHFIDFDKNTQILISVYSFWFSIPDFDFRLFRTPIRMLVLLNILGSSTLNMRGTHVRAWPPMLGNWSF